ncbi:hypothetical protein MAHJHV58_16930 [Mycobacterium avium subsp. hominissuis]|uniref:hypothetical protein n=1 Tax=Mycobacterium avium TaxID=1764 RepID=UPI001016ECFF|nr:hypothetical protein [Mycobacterium avium]MDO2387142.1 hypothetical protein [Mycobacterium avium subsp. hominissuis]
MGSAARKVSPSQAIAAADAYADGTLETEGDYLQFPQLRELGELVRRGLHEAGAFTGADLSRAKRRYGAEVVDHLHTAVYTAEAVRAWQRHRVVYQVHPALFAALSDTDTNTEIPCEVFARLPHPDPFVAFPVPIPMAPDPRSSAPVVEAPVLTGMLVTGLTEDREMCSTADPGMRFLSVALAAKLRYEGLDPTYEERLVTLPAAGRKTPAQMAGDMQALISVMNPDHARPVDDLDTEAFRLATGILLYVCSVGADTTTVQAAVHRGRNKNANARRRANTEVVGVGFHVGPALERHYRQSSAPAAHDGGGPVRPHVRRAHWHTYWTGPKSAPQKPELRWLHPIVVRAEERDQAVATVIPTGEHATRASGDGHM